MSDSLIVKIFSYIKRWSSYLCGTENVTVYCPIGSQWVALTCFDFALVLIEWKEVENMKMFIRSFIEFMFFFFFLLVETKENVPKPRKESQSKSKFKAQVVKKDSRFVFHHPWLACTLKMHTGLVLDIDISINNKYLATCSEGLTVCR